MTIHSFSTLARRIIPAKSFTVFRNRKDILNQSFSSHSSQAKEALIGRLLEAKDHSGKSFDEIATHLGLTNVYTAQLFMNQAQLKPHLIPKLKEMVPSISSADLLMMQKPPFRSFDPLIMQEPLIYRLVEAMQHYGTSIKYLVNEKRGDGIISAIDLYMDLEVIKGKHGEDRVVIILNGKFLPFIEQVAAENTAPKIASGSTETQQLE